MDNSKTFSLEQYLEKTTLDYVDSLPFTYRSCNLFDTHTKASTEESLIIAQKPVVDTLGVSRISYRTTVDLHCYMLGLQKSLTCDSHLLITGLLSWTEHSEYELQTHFWAQVEQMLVQFSWKHIVMQHVSLHCNYSSEDNYIEDYLYFSRESLSSPNDTVKVQTIKFISIYAQGFDNKKNIKISVK